MNRLSAEMDSTVWLAQHLLLFIKGARPAVSGGAGVPSVGRGWWKMEEDASRGGIADAGDGAGYRLTDGDNDWPLAWAGTEFGVVAR